MKLSDKIAVLRRQRSWSQEELAEWMSVSRQTISRWESGRAAPDAANIVRLSRLFNVSTDWLLLDELDLSSAPAAPEVEEEILEGQISPAEEPEELPAPAETPAVRRITENDAYEFVVFCQEEARRYALACAAVPFGPALFFILTAFSEMADSDGEMMLMLMGLFLGFIITLMGLCELLCAWLGKSERRLNGGKPFTLAPNALTWVSDACERSRQKLENRTAAAWGLSALSIPSFILCFAADPTGESVFWAFMALALPTCFATGAVFIRSHASRLHRCYLHLIERAEQEKSDDSTPG